MWGLKLHAVAPGGPPEGHQGRNGWWVHVMFTGGNLLLDMLIAASNLTLSGATLRLTAEDLATKQTDTRISEILAGSGTLPLHRLFSESIKVLRQANQLEDTRMAQ